MPCVLYSYTWNNSFWHQSRTTFYGELTLNFAESRAIACHLILLIALHLLLIWWWCHFSVHIHSEGSHPEETASHVYHPLVCPFDPSLFTLLFFVSACGRHVTMLWSLRVIWNARPIFTSHTMKALTIVHSFYYILEPKSSASLMVQ